MDFQQQLMITHEVDVQNLASAMEATIPTAGLLTFTKDEVKNAPLKCSTERSCKQCCFGFSAENIFYCNDILSVNNLAFLHDLSKLEISSFLQVGSELVIEINYASFGRLNFEITEASDNYKIVLTINVNYTPLFFQVTQQSGWKQFNKINPAAKYPEKEAFWKSVIHATTFQMEIVLTKNETCCFLNQFYNKSACELSYKQMQTKSFDIKDLRDATAYFIRWPFNIRYMVEAIISCGTVGSYFLDYVLFKKGRMPATVKRAKILLTSMYEHLRKDLSLSNLDFQELDESAKSIESEHFVLMKTVYVTPTKTVLILEVPTMTCRAFRILGEDNLVQIKFRSDSFSWVPNEMAKEVILPICQNGIVIAGKQFYEFGESHSLFCEGGSYFYATDDKNAITKWHKSLGNFKPAPAATVATRLGLFFTSAWNTRLKLSPKEFAVIPDITSSNTNAPQKQYIFTDGNGLISQRFAQQIKNRLELSYIPSAFQIRYAGFKGMLTVDNQDPSLKDRDGKYTVLFRESQKKFDAEATGSFDFDIVEWAKPATFNLHQTFIAMLYSLAVIDDKQKQVRERLQSLNREACYNVIKPLIDETTFFQKLEQLPKYFPVTKMQTKNITNEPFLRSMVEANATLEAKLLASKKQIPLPKELARSAFGVADHTGKLQPGDVFFKYTEQLSIKNGYGATIIKTGRVGVTRSPIYNPGDIRFYNAVDVPELRHLINVLVFPTVGDRPHPDEIGGGDLDGDVYSVFWDQALLLDRNIAADDYSNPEAKNVPKITIDQLQVEHPKFRAQHQQNRNLEQISNCHRVHLLTHNPGSVEFKYLLKNADKAVNYSKSGLPGRALSNNEKHFFWPTFMEKNHEPAFTSSHILCEMYDQANSWYQLICIAKEEAEKQRNLDTVVLSQVSVEPYFTDLFKKYKSEIQALMTKHQIKSEGELFANAFTSTMGALSTAKLPLINESSGTAVVQNQVYEIFKRYRTILLNQFSINWKEDMEKKREDIFSYEFPHVTSELVKTAQQLYSLAKKDKTCYSFPWLLWEGLDKWWFNNFEPKRVISENMSEKGRSEIKPQPLHFLRHIIIPKDAYNDLISPRLIPINGYSNFVKLCEAWTIEENLDQQLVLTAFQKFIGEMFSDVAGDKRNPIKSVTEAFTIFMVQLVANDREFKTSNSCYKAAQATLVKLAFLPADEILKGINIRKQIIDFPCFVIQVPEYLVNNFQLKYKLLEQKTGCNEIVLRKFKTKGCYLYYSVMSRGTLESCQKLKAMLTPKIDIIMSTSMVNTKKAITQEMTKILKDIFKQPSTPSQRYPARRSVLHLR